MTHKKTPLKKIKIIGIALVLLGLMLCFAGYSNTTIALVGVGCFLLGALLISDPITWI